MNKERTKHLKSLFVEFPDKGLWAEYVSKCSIGSKQNKPVKFEASIVWRSSSELSIFSDMRGSYESENEAFDSFEVSVAEYGGFVRSMSKKKIGLLEDNYGYPKGRNPYLLSEAVI
jgi:hypothetical protein